jgi:hypothetical protein
LGVEGHVGAPGWGLGRLTSNSIIHTDLHKPNNELVSAYLEHFWCILGALLVHIWNIFDARTNHGQTQIHKTHNSSNLGEATTFPLIIYSMPSHGTNTHMSFCHGTPKWEFRNFQNWDSHNFGIPQLWSPIILCANL